MEGKYFVIGIIAAALIVVIGLIYIGSPSSSQTISSFGTSTIEAQPDNVVVYFSARSTKDTAKEARDDIAKIVSELVYSMGEITDEDNIETQFYNIGEEYQWINGSQIFVGYTASQIIKVSSPNFSETGKIVDVGVDSGALIQYINFELDQETQNELKALALEKASRDARLKAEATAKGLGAKLGRIVSVSSSDFYYSPYRYFDAVAMTPDSAEISKVVTNIQPRTLEVTGNVQVVYSLR